MALFSGRIWQGFKRGLLLCCPNCGAFSIFRSYLKVKQQCDGCGIELSNYPSDDAPPYISMSLALTLIVPIALFHAVYWDASSLTVFLIWAPTAVFLILATLPSIKGSVIGVLWALDIKKK